MGGAEELPKYKLAAHYWAVIDGRMRALEGEEWASGETPEFVPGDGGPNDGYAYWRVGNRRLTVEEERVVETRIDDGQAARRRVIRAEGIIADEPATTADLD